MKVTTNFFRNFFHGGKTIESFTISPESEEEKREIEAIIRGSNISLSTRALKENVYFDGGFVKSVEKGPEQIRDSR